MAAIAAVLDQLDHPVFAAVGAVVVCWYSLQLVLSVLRGVKTYVLTGTLGLSTDLRGLGNWAVVTGATDGIGKAYAEQLAEKGLNIVLLSRTLAKLENVAQEIESRYNVTTKVLQVDFTGGPEIYKHIAELLNNLDIGVLVNNVGTNHSNPEYFTNSPNKFIPDILNVNILACTMMTKIVLPQMVKRRKGVIINISSAAGLNPLPLLLIYSSTKAFMDFFHWVYTKNMLRRA
ncbi:very-long-chain 3-oxoacyl-CoA reductase-B-like [Saccoglossus kowalevskii]